VLEVFEVFTADDGMPGGRYRPASPAELVAAVRQLDGVEERETFYGWDEGPVIRPTEEGTYLIVPVSASEEPT
jgi:hypothetical protein